MRRGRLPWLLVLPALTVIALVAFYPLVQTVFYSFTNARMSSSRPWHFVGLRNYADILRDLRFWNALRLTVSFATVTVALEFILGLAVALEFILGLAVALVIHSNFRGRGLVRAAILVPWAIPTVMSTQMWKWMYHDVFGVVNDVAMRLHLLTDPVAWTADPAYVFPAVCAVDVWKTTPFLALMLLAGLQVIPDDVYEAAGIDGATSWQQFLKITLPLLRPVIAVALVFRTLDALRSFDLFYVMVGNRPRFQTLAVLDQQILVEFSRVGLGSALSVLIFLLIALFVLLYMRLVGGQE